MSDFNMFMKLNLDSTPVYLTSEEVAAAAVAAVEELTTPTKKATATWERE
ncbi:MAG: hypothetical protein ACI3Y0_05830 [Prevotella sp.]